MNESMFSGICVGFKVGLYQSRMELRRHFTLVRAMFSLIGYALFLVIIKMGLIEWIGGIDIFQWIVTAYVGAAISIAGIITIAMTIIGDQEDGTLLRAKILPGGLIGHLSAKVIVLAITSLLSILLVLVVSHIGSGTWLITPSIWLFVTPLFVALAIAVTSPIGLIMGGIARKITDFIYVMIVGYVIIFISDVFIPSGLLPEWVTMIARIFPVYWLGYISRLLLLGSDSLLINLSASEWILGGFVLTIWLAIGILFLPKAMRKLSRRQSPSMFDKRSP